MDILSKLVQLILRGGAETAEFNRIRGEMHRSNRSIILVFSLIAMAALGLLFVSSFFAAGLAANHRLYAIGFCLMLTIYLIAAFPGRTNGVILLIDMYLFAAVLLAVGTVIGTVLSPKEIAATYIALLLAVPQLFTDRPYRMYILIACSVVAFVICTLKLKDPVTWSSDITNAIVFGALSTVLTTYSIRTRVERNCLQERIRFMAENDQLTGLRNRNSYEQSLAKAALLGTNAVYCVYVDVNGLHELNNSKGHEAGDQMLKYVASVMQNLFGEKDTYRVGGDEFVVLGVNKPMEEIDRLIQEMKQAVSAAGYHVAVGVSHVEKLIIEVESIVKDAEQEMYRDKAAYYRQSGVDRRKR